MVVNINYSLKSLTLNKLKCKDTESRIYSYQCQCQWHCDDAIPLLLRSKESKLLKNQ